MGKWHKPWQVAIIIKKLQQDLSIKQLYEYELAKGWTNAISKRFFWTNTKERIFNLTGKKFTCFISPNTTSYKDILKYYVDMELEFKKDPARRKILEDADKEDLITIIEILEDELKKSKSEKIKKQQTKAFCLIIRKIVKYTKLSERKTAFYFEINRKTYHNYKNVVGHGDVYRKDFKHNNWYYKNLILTLFEKYKCTQGPFKLWGIVNKNGINISIPTVRRILKDSNLFVCTLSKKYQPKELKNTQIKRNYLLNKEVIENSKSGELFSMDFMYIKTNYGNMYVHGAIDIKTQKIYSLELSNTMSAKTVIKTINNLPSTAKIVNTDCGTQYFDKEVISLLNKRRILHSCGSVGKSTDNGWIERFWKRLRCECLNIHDTYNASALYLHKILDDYKKFWNFERVISTLNWLTPNDYAILVSGVN